MIKAQLSIDYMIVFSFVLIIFILIFGIVATQRIQNSQQQDYAQLQVVAQTIAQDINIAYSSGSGYAQNVSLPSGTGLVNYNLSITSSGTVIAYDNSTGRLAYAYAYAPVGRIISSQSYMSPNSPHTYMLPVANGFIYLQNSHNNICIDYVCNTTSSQAYETTVYTKQAHAAQMNGQTSYIYVSNSMSLLEPFVTNSITITAWVYVNKFPSGASETPVINYGTSQQGNYCFGPRIYVSSNTLNGGFQNLNRGSSDASLTITNNTWYFVAMTYSGSSNQLALYVNSRKTIINSVVPLDSPNYIYDLVFGSSQYTYNAGQGSCDGSSPLNGSVSNVQIYDTALNANQINQLESSGINGEPVQSQNLSGWWPLNGNANDYSGNGNDGRSSAVIYPAIVQIYANVTNATLAPIQGDFVGFSSSLGKFQKNTQSVFNFTNSDGIATTVLMQTNNTGYADLKVTPFEGNVYTAKNLSGWWPINENQGNVLLNLANSSNPGILTNGYWNNINYVGLFSGYNSYVNIPNSTNTELYNTPISLSFWVSPAQAQKLESVIFKPGEYEACVGNSQVVFGDASGGEAVAAYYNFSDNNWYNIVLVAQGGSPYSLSVYINGAAVTLPVSTGTWSASANTMNMVIGSNQSSSAYSCANAVSFNGKIANVQLYKGNLTQQEVSQLYYRGIGGSPVLAPAITDEGWWPLNGNINDYSGNNNNGFGAGSFSFTNPNTQQTETGSKVSYLSTGFSRGGSYISFNNINNYADILTTGSFTITAWINMNSCTGLESIAGDQAASGPGLATGFQFYACTNSATFRYPLVISGRNLNWPAAKVGNTEVQTFSFPQNVWEMVTAEYNGSTGYTAVYLNNEVFNSTMLNPHLNLAQAGPFEVGNSQFFGNTDAFNGSIANVQLYSGTLSESDINNLYQSGIYGMPRPNDGLVAWWPLNGNANDYSGNNNNGIPHNTIYKYTVNPSAIPGLGGYGISSPGYGPTILATVHSYPKFSIASWVYLDQPVASASTAYLGTHVSGSSGYGFFRSSSMQGFLVGSGSATSNSVTTFPIGKWTYVVGTYDGYNVSYYVDGLLIAKGISTSPSPAGILETVPAFAGSVANIEYYNVSLTAGQVYQLYNNQLPVTYAEQVPLSWGT